LNAAQPGGRWSKELRDVIIEASAELGVEWLVNAEVESVDASGVTLKDGQVIASQTVIWTVGVQANGLTAQIDAPRDRQGVCTWTAIFRCGHDDIYATGDVAYAATDDKGNHALMTCQHAILLGKFAGNNAAASLLTSRLAISSGDVRHLSGSGRMGCGVLRRLGSAGETDARRSEKAEGVDRQRADLSAESGKKGGV
jgi:NADH dehydrogenase FAD-containing subunit